MRATLNDKRHPAVIGISQVDFRVLDRASACPVASRHMCQDPVKQQECWCYHPGSGVMRSQGDNTKFPAELLAEVMYEPGFGVVIPAGVG